MTIPVHSLRPEHGFAGKTRVIKIKGHGKGRCGLVVETDILAGIWQVQFDDTQLIEKVNPFEFALEPKQERY